MDSRVRAILGPEADDLLDHQCGTIARDLLHLPGPAFVDEVISLTDRTPRVLRNLQAVFDHGRLGRDRVPVHSPRGSGHRAFGRVRRLRRIRSTSIRRTSSSWPSRDSATPSPRPWGCSGRSARKYAHKIPFIVKINHNELLSYPNTYDQRLFGSVDQAFDMGAVAVGATIYYGSRGIPAADRGDLRRLRAGP